MSVNPRTKRTAAWAAAGVLGAVAVGAAALSQVGIAAADSASASPSASAPAPGGPRGPGGPGDWHGGPGRGGPDHAAELTAVAKALGMTETELQTQLKAGKSLAAIAKAKGVPLQTVIDAIVAQEKTELAAAVMAGRFTQAQADQMSKDVVARVTAEVNRVRGIGGPGGPGDWHGGPGRGGPDHAAELTAVAKALGMTETELQTQLKAGKSLAAIAKAKGVPLQTVIDAIVAQEKTELAAAVKAGRFTQAQADQMSKDVVARVTAEVNRVPGIGGPGGPGGPGDWHGGPGHGGMGMPGGPGAANGSTSSPAPSGTVA